MLKFKSTSNIIYDIQHYQKLQGSENAIYIEYVFNGGYVRADIITYLPLETLDEYKKDLYHFIQVNKETFNKLIEICGKDAL